MADEPQTTDDRGDGLEVFAWLAGEHTAQNELALLLEFEHRLDLDRLQAALEAVVRDEPVLARRFVPAAERAYWRHRPDGAARLTVELLSGDEEARAAWLARPLDRAGGEMAAAALGRGNTDTLVLKLDHVASDARGLRAFAAALAQSYTNPAEPKRASTGAGAGRPRLQEVLRRLEVQAWAATFRPGPPAAAHLVLPAGAGAPGPTAFAVRWVDRDGLARLQAAAKCGGTTMTAVLAAGLARSLARAGLLESAVATIGVTIDLRRHLPPETPAGLGNLSTGANLAVPVEPGERFEATLARAGRELEAVKRDMPGLAAALLLEQAFGRAPFAEAEQMFRQRRARAVQTGRSIPYLSNLGVIGEHELRFGEARPVRCHFAGPAMRAPGFLLSAVGCNGGLSLGVRYFPVEVAPELVGQILDGIIAERAPR